MILIAAVLTLMRKKKGITNENTEGGEDHE